MWREARRGYPKPIGDTRTPSDMGLGFYFSSPLKMGMGTGIPELYEFGFGESKIRPRPAPLPCLELRQGVAGELALHSPPTRRASLTGLFYQIGHNSSYVDPNAMGEHALES
ncbi:hypothetical protein QL285_037172 [Trifolium repens]|nr:hypothetical protein QL285_037172 [Trifolium repens]